MTDMTKALNRILKAKREREGNTFAEEVRLSLLEYAKKAKQEVFAEFLEIFQERDPAGDVLPAWEFTKIEKKHLSPISTNSTSEKKSVH